MAFNWSALASFVKEHPSLVITLATPLVTAAASDPSLITDAVDLTHGGNIGSFVQKHPTVVKGIADAALGAVTENPQLLTEAIAAFSAPGPVSASGGG